MSRESDFKTRIAANAPLMAVLTGGVHTKAETGPEGITRDTVGAAFDGNGHLKPCALVVENAIVPDSMVHDEEAIIASVAQRVQIFLYERRGYTNIDAALPLLFTLFFGHRFTDSFPVEYAGAPVTRGRDEGALRGASLARMDFIVRSVQGD